MKENPNAMNVKKNQKKSVNIVLLTDIGLSYALNSVVSLLCS